MPAFHSMTSSDAVVVGWRRTVGAWTAVQLAERGVETGGSAGGGDTWRRREQPCRGHGARPGRHRAGHRARHADPGLLRRQRRPVPARLRLRRAGVPDAVLLRRRSGAGQGPHRAAADTRPRCRVVAGSRHRQHAHRHRTGRHARRVVRTGRRLHRRAAKCAGLHRGANGPQGGRAGALPRSPACAPRAAAWSVSTPPTGPSTPTVSC